MPKSPASRCGCSQQIEGRFVLFSVAMGLELPVTFGECGIGSRINLVARLKCWDPSHEAHWLSSNHDGVSFLACGLLDGSGDTYSLLNAEFRRQFPVPLVCLDEKSHVFKHYRPTWESMNEVVEMCAGFGGMTQGLVAAGFTSVAVVDFNDRMMNLFGKQCEADQVVGDVNQLETLVAVQKISRGAGVLAAGFACQPFSKLGDERGGMDDRALCLRGILASAYYLQVQAVVLECVQPATLNTFVEQEIQHFQKISGFHISQHDLHLQDIWPARRSRAWWLLSSPMLGKIPLYGWPKMGIVSKVRHLIPYIQPWDPADEDDLALTAIEFSAFGCDQEIGNKYMLNIEGCAPCALHSWGSQLHACRCGCRPAGLSEHRLREKGLFGCLVRSCPTETKESLIRHIHPNEVMMLCGYDPIIDFGDDPRLTLAAAGQMASPLQASWVFATLAERILALQGIHSEFKAEAQLQAYMTWLIMRGRQVWPVDHETIVDRRSASLVQFWKSQANLSLHELLHPQRWPDLALPVVSIASILDLIIRQQQSSSMVVPFHPPGDVAMTAIDDEDQECEPTPWVEKHENSGIDMPPPNAEFCTVLFMHEKGAPIRLLVSNDCTFQQLVNAHEKLVGPFQIQEVCDQHGMILPHSLVLQAGQVLCIRCTEFQHPPVVSRVADVLSVESSLCPLSDRTAHDMSVCGEVSLSNPAEDARKAHVGDPKQVVSPTVPWTCLPAEDVSHAIVREQHGPAAESVSVDFCKISAHESWISAAPLLGLQNEQFLSLKVPSVVVNQHLVALKKQVISIEDRLKILQNQGNLWTDDEFCHQIELLLQLCHARTFADPKAPAAKYMMIDPLIFTGWATHGSTWCHAWARDHAEVKTEGLIILTACMLDKHWIPAVLTPNGDVLHLCTWDAPAHSHDRLNAMVEVLAQRLGFNSVAVLRQHRMFLSSDKCGALAMAFLHHTVFDSMLPTTVDEADMVHARLRAVYVQFLMNSPAAHRPWIWGAGDEEDAPFMNEPGCSSSSNPVAATNVALATGGFHSCIPKEDRLELLRAKGQMWGDDEVRFHLNHMIAHPNNVSHNTYATIPGFVMMDPLLLSTWDSIGPTLCETWCRRNTDVAKKGVHVVAIFLANEHWFPVWMVPHGRTLVAHVIQDPFVDHQILLPLLAVMKESLEFEETVLHTIPCPLPQHELCGAAAVAFLGHVMVGADLPQTLSDLKDYHANMKAGFVNALFDGTCCICPVAWGSGSSGLQKLLAEELVKHGVPEAASLQRAQQAIQVIGGEQVQQALQSKNVWRALKVVGNNAKFQFLLPDELANLVASNKSVPVGKRLKMQGIKTRPSFPEAMDPSKLTLPEGIFQAQGKPVLQIAPKQLGPLAHGIALLTLDEAMPYLKAGKQVSQEPLAIAVFLPPGGEIDTVLPHTKVLTPCVCIANNEPLLAEATVVQLGSGFVEKLVVPTTIALDQMEVVTIKVLVYKDECPIPWDEFTSAPIKHLVRVFPVLTRCHVDECSCDAWHNKEKLPLKDPILDVWRRQFLKAGFKQAPAGKSDMFSVCLRVPKEIMPALLAQSGTSGAYTEPRTPDGKEVLPEYVVVWAPRMSQSELSHLMRTNLQ